LVFLTDEIPPPHETTSCFHSRLLPLCPITCPPSAFFFTFLSHSRQLFVSPLFPTLFFYLDRPNPWYNVHRFNFRTTSEHVDESSTPVRNQALFPDLLWVLTPACCANVTALPPDSKAFPPFFFTPLLIHSVKQLTQRGLGSRAIALFPPISSRVLLPLARPSPSKGRPRVYINSGVLPGELSPPWLAQTRLSLQTPTFLP